MVKSKSTRVCDFSSMSSSNNDIDASTQCTDDELQDDKEWVFPASMPTAPKASDWERRITISLTLPQALGILFFALCVVVIIWRLRKSKHELMQAAAVAAALEKQKHEQQQAQTLHQHGLAVDHSGTIPHKLSSSPEATQQRLSLPNFSRDPNVTSDSLHPLSNPHPVKHLVESSANLDSLCPRNPQIFRVAHLNRAMSESDLRMLPPRSSRVIFHGSDATGKQGQTEVLGRKAVDAGLDSKMAAAKGGVEGKFWKDGNATSSGSDSDSSLSYRENDAVPRGGSDDEESRREIEFIHFGTAEADSHLEKSPAFSDASTLPRNSSASPSTGTIRHYSRRRLSEADKSAAAAASVICSSPPHFTSYDTIMPSVLSSIEAELKVKPKSRSSSKALSRDGSGSSSGNTPHSTPKASPQVKVRNCRDATISPLHLDLGVVAGGGGKRRPDKSEIPQFERTPTNHYKTTFEEIKPVGQGGFGSVFQVRGRVDNRLYAVKKVKLPKNDAVLKRKMMRETVMMSTLSHMNIVRYHTAWEEHVLSSELEPHSNGNDSRSSWGMSSSITDCTDRSDPDVDSDNIVPVLFIQMEWCDISVQRWLQKRTVINLSDVHSMFVQLLMGVQHMHDQGQQAVPISQFHGETLTVNTGLIHRDIKPDNMFILPSGVLKIGDDCDNCVIVMIAATNETFLFCF